MPWSESTKMDEKLKFVARYLDGESISDLCCKFVISRVTGHKVIARYRESGLEAMTDAIRSDNGVPFSSPHAIHGLSKLSVHWLRLGIAIERIKPGNPQQNGRHERMHRTLKQCCARLAGMNMLQQQEMFERFMDEYNNERPLQALGMKRPANLYRPSSRPYEGVPPVSYPFHDKTVTITACGRICVARKKIHFSTVLAGHDVGIKQID